MSSYQPSAITDQEAIPPDHSNGRTAAGDLTGRDRMVWNVMASWAGHMVFVVAGFILPRFIDRHLGQETLGVWDFGWSLVSYFGLAQIGIGSSVNRYVAMYRAAGDTAGLNRAVSSVMFVQYIAALIVLAFTFVATWCVPSLLSNRLGAYVGEAYWVVFLLGVSLAVQMLFNAYCGVLTGCHRWDLYNALNAGFYAATVAGMIAAVLAGGGLRSLAAVNLIGTALSEVTRAVVAYAVCPGLHIRLREARWPQILEMLTFGGKTVLNSVSRLLIYQTNSLLVVGYLGPASLAVFSRPKALVSHAQTLVNKFGFVLTPTASSLQAGKRSEELRELLVQAGRFATYLALPMVLFLSIMGDPLLKLWMGPRYEQGLVLAILAVGHLTEMTRQPVVNILTGLNMHGRVALVNLGAAICSAVLGFLALGVLHWGLIGAALSMVIPLILINGGYVPIYACRRLEMPLRRFLWKTNLGPILCAIPFVTSLAFVRLWFADRSLHALAVGSGVGGLIMGFLYWRYVLPQRLRGMIGSIVERIFRRAALQKT